LELGVGWWEEKKRGPYVAPIPNRTIIESFRVKVIWRCHNFRIGKITIIKSRSKFKEPELKNAMVWYPQVPCEARSQKCGSGRQSRKAIRITIDAKMPVKTINP